MCGISGVAGFSNVSRVLTESIRQLEYRGYDSCGVAVINEIGQIEVKKNIGAVDHVSTQEDFASLKGTVGIAHTRWATHGEVTRENTHPHTCCKSEFSLVHNGIISNYNQLKEMLTAKGHKFISQTDTEAIVHLVEEEYKKTRDAEKAFTNALQKVDGTFAVVMLTIHEPDKIFCAKNESPLIIGVGDENNYIGSDFNAFINHTKNAVILDDWEYAIVSKDRYTVKHLSSAEVIEKEITKITWDNEMTKKGGYPHYMLKEIHEQPTTVRNALTVDREKIRKAAEMIASAKHLYLTGVGTTYYVALFGQYQFAHIADTFAPAISSDEFKHVAKIDKDTVVLAFSQSGETYDTLTALKYVRNNGGKNIAVVNVTGSAISRMADHTILQGSGPEICVISTKAAISQIILLTLMSIEVALIKGKISEGKKEVMIKELETLPEYLQNILNEKSGLINTIAKKYAKVGNWLYLGRGKYYPIALESALKMKEVAYVHAEGMPAGFLKHGTLALIDEQLYSVIFVPSPEDNDLFKETIKSAEEIKARKGFILGFHFGGKEMNRDLFNEEIILPETSAIIAPIVEMVVAQLFSYFTAVTLKRNIDKPRSLAKSVTV